MRPAASTRPQHPPLTTGDSDSDQATLLTVRICDSACGSSQQRAGKNRAQIFEPVGVLLEKLPRQCRGTFDKKVLRQATRNFKALPAILPVPRPWPRLHVAAACRGTAAHARIGCVDLLNQRAGRVSMRLNGSSSSSASLKLINGGWLAAFKMLAVAFAGINILKAHPPTMHAR